MALGNDFFPDWRPPWQWPAQAQRMSWWLAMCVGLGVTSPLWLTHWQTWTEAQALAEKTLQQQEDTRIHQQRSAQLQRQLAQEASHQTQTLDSADPTQAVLRALMLAAQTHHLDVSHLSLDAPSRSAALQALSMQHLPVHVQLQGAGTAWLTWWAQWPTWAPGAVASSLQVKTEPAGGVTVQLKLLLPQRASPRPRAWPLASLAETLHQAATDPFSADDWAEIQWRHAQQHPSFVAWVAPERQRARQPLEAFARERLHYVGWVSDGGVAQALVQVRDAAHDKPSVTPRVGDTVYRVAVGGYVGQNWGRVFMVTPQGLGVRELVRSPDGVWSARRVVLPLEGGGP